MKSRLGIARLARIMWVTCLILPVFLGSTLMAQNVDKLEKSGRKLIYTVDPEYPWDLKRAHIGGVVRMMVTVSSHGAIQNVVVIGGNPVLVESAVRAVKKWKYAPGESETQVQVNVNFDPNH